MSLFDSTFFVANRRNLRIRTKCNLIIITANGSLQRSGDDTYSFRQDSNFWYLTGLNDPDLVLVMDGNSEYLIVPKRHEIIEKFDGVLDLENYHKVSGLKQILSDKAGWDKLKKSLNTKKSIATIVPTTTHKLHTFYPNPARSKLLRKLKGVKPGIKTEDLRSQFMQMRMIKQPQELKALQAAVDITIASLKEVSKRQFREFNYEYEIEAAVVAGFRKRGAKGNAFSPIVAGGSNACQVHYIKNCDKLPENGLVLLDVGAEIENYAGDISRTYKIGEITQRQQAVIDAVLEVQNYGIRLLKPGITFLDHDRLTRKFMGEKLRQLGLINTNDEVAVNKYYPHYSHFLGLDTHDTGDYKIPFEPNMVVTMEPGIYIPEEGIGVRVEDDVLITLDGSEVLSEGLPIQFG